MEWKGYNSTVFWNKSQILFIFHEYPQVWDIINVNLMLLHIWDRSETARVVNFAFDEIQV